MKKKLVVFFVAIRTYITVIICTFSRLPKEKGISPVVILLKPAPIRIDEPQHLLEGITNKIYVGRGGV